MAAFVSGDSLMPPACAISSKPAVGMHTDTTSLGLPTLAALTWVAPGLKTSVICISIFAAYNLADLEKRRTGVDPNCSTGPASSLGPSAFIDLANELVK